MTLASIELQRARRCLNDFCQRRNRGSQAGAEWQLAADGNRFEICVGKQPVLRLCYERAVWCLTLPRGNGEWLPYPPRPEMETITAVIEELEQAPLHVHW